MTNQLATDYEYLSTTNLLLIDLIDVIDVIN